MMQEKKSALSSFLDLPFLECQTIGKESVVSYILLTRLEDYWKFVSDESGHMRRCLFDSDGWDFLSANQVNKRIARALADPADSWSVSNGVTIIATNATVLGKIIQLKDIQIIKGLPITKIIYRHFQGGSVTSKDGGLLVTIIVTSDAQVHNQIIRSMSHQNRLTSAELQAIRNRLNSARYRGDS
jgi:hypothetical protein